MNLAILISGKGSNMLATYDAVVRGELDAKIVVVIASSLDSFGLKKAKELGLSTILIEKDFIYSDGTHIKKYINSEEFEKKIINELDKYDVDYVCLFGFLHILRDVYMNSSYGKKTINLHPSISKEIKGIDTHKQIFKDKIESHGSTVHFIRSELDDFDEKNIIANFKINTKEFLDDKENGLEKMKEKIKKLENNLVIKALQKLSNIER